MFLRTVILLTVITVTLCGCEKSPKSLAKEAVRMQITHDYVQGKIDDINIIEAYLENTNLNYKKYRGRGNATISMITDREMTYSNNNESIHLPKGTKIKVLIDIKLSFMVGSNGHIETNIVDYGRETIKPY